MTRNPKSRQVGAPMRNDRTCFFSSKKVRSLALGKSGWMPLFSDGVGRLAAAAAWLSKTHLIRTAKLHAAEVAYQNAVSEIEWSAYLDRVHAATLKQKPKLDAEARIRKQERDQFLANEREKAEAISRSETLRRVNESPFKTQKEAEANGWIRESMLRPHWKTPKKGVKGVNIHGAIYYRPEDVEQVFTRTDAGENGLRVQAEAEPAYYRDTRYGYYPVYAESDYEAMPRKMKRLRNPRAHARRAKTLAKAKAWRLANRYPNWREALPDAAEAMFSLNRYAKHSSCTPENRDDIYDLKNRFVRILYKQGLCESAHLHQAPMPGKRCYGCGGTGEVYDEDDRGVSDPTCYRCGGSGWYLKPKTAEYICFKFSIGGKDYCWHQPRGSVDFEYRLVEAPDDWVPDQGGKELKIPRARLSAAKEVIRYVLTHGEAEVAKSNVA